VIKESSYSKVLINAANRMFLSKNEDEFLANMFDAEKGNKKIGKLELTPSLSRKLNLLTLNLRPFCNFCSAVCGATWFTNESINLC